MLSADIAGVRRTRNREIRMQALFRAVARLSVMAAVMAAVVVGVLVAGLGTTTAVAVGIVFAGAAGLVGVARRPRVNSGTAQIEAMLAADPLDRQLAPAMRAPSPTEATRVESMAPKGTTEADPEANVPRWRRPSLLEARRADPTLLAATARMPVRFGGPQSSEGDVRVVRYAVVPVLDRPDEVLGLRLTDLGQGDEVQVLGASGAFLEILCPNGDQGFVHRTVVGQRVESSYQVTEEADDALTALLTARGLI
jgi:hypothetical protein